MKKIGIIGSTGMLGQPVTCAFVNSGFEVTLFVRDVAKARKSFGTSARYFQGDLQHQGEIKKFLKGLDGLYINLSVAQGSREKDFQPERDGLQNLLRAIKKSGIERIGYLSSLVYEYEKKDKPNWWVFDIKKEAVLEIKAAGPSYSIFHASTFMESFDKGPYRQGNKLVLAGKSKYPLHLIAGADYARQVVAAFKRNEGNNSYKVQGAEGYAVEDAAGIFAENYKKMKMEIIRVPFGIVNILGRFSARMNYAANITEALNNYPEKFEAAKTWEELGVPPTKFIDYCCNA